MPQFAANLTMMYPEMGMLERMRAAQQDGFGAVECLFPYAHEAQAWAQVENGEVGDGDGDWTLSDVYELPAQLDDQPSREG